MRLALFILGVSCLYGQPCAPSWLPVGDAVSGALDSESCLLQDGSAYQSYRLDLPVRGRLALELTAPDTDLVVILRDTAGRKMAAGAIEAGTYTVLVTGKSGAYRLKSTFSAEPAIFCAGFPPLGVNQTIGATLGEVGCRAPDGSPYDSYTVNSFAPGILTVAASAEGFTPRVIVRTSEGAAVGAESAELDAGATYEVVVYSDAGGGRYELATSFEPAADQPCRPLKTIEEPGTASGAIGGDSCTNYNYYGLTVAETGVVELTASSASFTPTLTLFDESGTALASDSSRVAMRLRPGKYLVQVLSTISTGGDYELTYRLTPGPPSACTIQPGSLTAAQAGTMTATACRADAYSFTLPSSGTLDVTLTATEFEGALELRDAKDNVLVRGDERLTADLPAGSYTVAVRSLWGSGPYLLAASHTPLAIPQCDFVQPLDINGGYIQKLGYRSCRDANGQPVDYYEFTLPSDSVVAGIITSSEIDGHLTITDAAGRVLRTDDNSYGLRNPLIIEYLRAGTYRAEARAATSTAGGYYQIDLRTIPGERPPFCTPRGKLEPGASVTGTIDFSRCQYLDATFADIYEFRLAQESTVDLRLESADFDPHLILLNAKGSRIGEGDVHFTDVLPAGTYFVVAKPATDYRSAGTYRLSLAAEESVR